MWLRETKSLNHFHQVGGMGWDGGSRANSSSSILRVDYLQSVNDWGVIEKNAWGDLWRNSPMSSQQLLYSEQCSKLCPDEQYIWTLHIWIYAIYVSKHELETDPLTTKSHTQFEHLSYVHVVRKESESRLWCTSRYCRQDTEEAGRPSVLKGVYYHRNWK